MEQQKSKEWFEKRKGRVTGSNVGAILGLNPYKTAEDVLRQMVRDYHEAEREFVSNVATEWGSFNESGAQAEYTMETGNKVQECGFFVHPEYDWLGASPDGLLPDINAVIEIKAPYGQRDKNPPNFKTAEEQPHYYAQMQIEMGVTRANACHFYQWAPHGSRLEIVPRDDEYIKNAIKDLLGFYEWFLSELDNPDHLEPKRIEINTLEADKLIREHEELSEAIERASERKKEVMTRLVEIAKHRDALICGHKLTKVEKQGSVSYAKALKKYAPNADIEPFRGNASISWRLS